MFGKMSIKSIISIILRFIINVINLDSIFIMYYTAEFLSKNTKIDSILPGSNSDMASSSIAIFIEMAIIFIIIRTMIVFLSKIPLFGSAMFIAFSIYWTIMAYKNIYLEKGWSNTTIVISTLGTAIGLYIWHFVSLKLLRTGGPKISSLDFFNSTIADVQSDMQVSDKSFNALELDRQYREGKKFLEQQAAETKAAYDWDQQKRDWDQQQKDYYNKS